MRSSTQRPAGVGVDGSIRVPTEKREAGVSRRSFLATGVAVGVGAGLATGYDGSVLSRPGRSTTNSTLRQSAMSAEDQVSRSEGSRRIIG
jgi:hypothetical protein